MALVGTGPLDFLSHRLQHLDCEEGSFISLLDDRTDGLLPSIQQWFWRLGNAWNDPDGGEVRALEWWSGRDLRDLARSTLLGLSSAVWCRLELKCPCITN